MKVSLNDLELIGKSGIYRIYNIFNGKSYIGSSVNLKKRLNEHLRDLKNRKHHSIHLQRAWNKYGEKSFDIEILEYCPPEICINKEQYYLDLEQSYYKERGYNTCSTAGSSRGYRHSEESKAKMRDTHKKQFDLHLEIGNSTGRYHSRKVKCVSSLYDTPYTIVFNSLKWAEIILGITAGTIRQAIVRKTNLKAKPYLTFDYYED